ncbi:MAG: YARHG domain-containing protein [Lachnospiraceae bacterium]|nr:YARHG domain-containing protein [Lachnospiraceae bacterium]
MRTDKDPRRDSNRDYIPNDEIDREEKADIRQQKKGNVMSVILGGIVVISLIAFLFVLLDSGVLTGETQRLYGSPEAPENAGSGELTQEEKKAAEEEARKKEEEAKEKKRQEEEAKRAEEEAAQKAKQEEEEKAREEEERKKAEERAEKQAEIDEKEAKRKKELEEEQEVLSGDYILPESNSRYYSEEEISGLTDREVLFALNEIYARKGRIFTGEEFKRYFESKSWYNGTIPAEEFDANQNERFNEYEKANINLLVKEAQDRGIR